MSVRAFPAPKHQRPAGWSGPWCRWCGDPITTGRPNRSAHDGRKHPDGRDEPRCRQAYLLHTDHAVQFAHVADRDGLKCYECGELPMKWRRGSVVYIGGEPGTEFIDPRNPLMAWVRGTRYCKVEWVTALELEHTRPLWSVSHLPDEERRPFFGPDNLRLLGPCCHKPKTKAEAKTRAKEKRQAKMCLEVPREPPKRPIRGRGFQKGHRPLKSRNTFADRRRHK